jgi:hypothetical protein
LLSRADPQTRFRPFIKIPFSADLSLEFCSLGSDEKLAQDNMSKKPKKHESRQMTPSHLYLLPKACFHSRHRQGGPGKAEFFAAVERVVENFLNLE